MSDVKPGTALAAAPGAHRQDESPAGYSLAGWSPPEPTSASPARLRMHYSGPAGRQFCSERPTVSYSTVSAEGSTPLPHGHLPCGYRGERSLQSLAHAIRFPERGADLLAGSEAVLRHVAVQLCGQDQDADPAAPRRGG